ncbi:hypothetical protein Ndes2526A_g00744 [Nannochloris sp. 'desiccata']|nr:hypothetical protein KSW81_004047 [Chlorella desiccata (nom. nud.)]
MKTLSLANRSAPHLAITQSTRNLRIKPRVYTSVCVNCKLSTSTPDVVVVGGGIAGLLAANVFSKQVDKVLLVEKDDINGSVESETFQQTARRRRGVPHIAQPHQLVIGAVQALDTLLPNFRAEAIAAGGLDLDLGKHVFYYDYNGYFPREVSGLKGLGVSRRFVEERIRDRVLKEGKESGTLEVIGGKVEKFLWEGNDVKGVKLCENREIHTSLVVDATGRSSDTATKLAEHNLPRPRLVCVNPNVASASRIVKMPKDFEKNHDWLLLVCKSQPNGKRGGTLLPTENGRWQVTLAEIGGDGPENTDEGFLEFAKSLPDQTMYNILKQCEPVTPVMKYLAMRNEMICYHEIDMPRGLLAIGDSVMRLNALYGQGIGASSQSVVLLKQTLSRALKDATSESERKQVLNTLGATFQPLLAKNLMPAWNLATKADLKYPTTTTNVPLDPPSSTDKLITDTLLTAAQSNAIVYHRLLEVAHLTAPPSKLFTDARTWVPLMRAAAQQVASPADASRIAKTTAK